MKFQDLFLKKTSIFWYVSFLILVVNLTLLSLNVTFLDSLKLTLAMIIQGFPGVYLWRRVSQREVVSRAELLGLGLALGTSMSIVSSSISRNLPMGGIGWAIPFLFTILLALRNSFIKRDTMFTARIEESAFKNKFKIASITVVASVQIFVWATAHNLNPKGWWKYHLDVPYFESLSNSLAEFGTSNNFMKPDMETRYHWFAYAWIGDLNKTLNIEPFIVQTRLLPLVAMLMAAIVAHSWAKDFAQTTTTSYMASLMVVVGPGFAIGSLVLLRSPSSAIATGWALALSLLFFRCLGSEKVQASAYLALGLLSISVVGGKGINVILIGSGVLVLLMHQLIQQRSYKVKNLGVYVVVLLTLVCTYWALIHTQDERSLKFGIYIGWPAWMLTVLPFSLGIFLNGLLKKKEQRSDLQRYGLSILLVGCLLSLVTKDPAGGNLYFLAGALSLSLIPSLVFIEQLLQKSSRYPSNYSHASLRIFLKFKGFWLSTIVSALLTSWTWIYFENALGIVGDVGRAMAPALIWIFGTAFAYVLTKMSNGFFINFRHNLIAQVLVSCVMASIIGITASLVRGPIYAESKGYVGYGESNRESIGAFSSSYIQAGEWIKDNVDSNARFFTNRQCIDPKARYENCQDIWFYASAFSQRQFLIEGGAYNINDQQFVRKMNNDQRVSLRFSLNPNLLDLNYLWSKDVRWGWIDKQVVNPGDWNSFATEVFSNKDIIVIQLVDPTELVKSQKIQN